MLLIVICVLYLYSDVNGINFVLFPMEINLCVYKLVTGHFGAGILRLMYGNLNE